MSSALLRRRVLGALLAGLAAGTFAAGARAQDEEAVEGLEPAFESHPALAVDPASLPRAEPGRWSDWDPAEPLAPEHRELFTHALRAYAAGDYPGTLAPLYALLEREPDLPPALHQAGIVHFRLRRYGDCVTLLERFVEVVPHEVGATRALAHGLYSLGRYAEARDHYQRVLAAQPESAEALRGLALSHLRLGESSRALELLEQVVELEPEHADAHAWIAHVLLDEGRLEQARAACERSLKLDPSRPRSWFLSSGILAELGDDEGAEAARARFEELSRLQQEQLALEARLVSAPRDPELLAALAGIQVRRGDGRGARATVERLLRLDPGAAGFRILALEVSLALGDAEGARRAAFALETHCAESVEAWRRLEQYWASVGDVARQIQAGERHRRMTAGTGER